MAQHFDWDYESIEDYAELCGDGLKALPETCFWKKQLSLLFGHLDFWDMLGIQRRGLYLLSGPAGNGRHMIGKALVGEYMALSGIPAEKTGVLQFRAADFPKSTAVEDALEMIEAAFEKGEQYKLKFLIFDEMDLYAHGQILSNAIADCVDNKDSQLIVLCYVQQENLLSRRLKEFSTVLRVNCPSAEQRTAFLDSKFTWETPSTELPGQMTEIALTLDGMTTEELAEATEGFSYAELQLVAQYVLTASLERMNANVYGVNLFCDARTVRECVHTVKIQRSTGNNSVIQVQNMVSAVSAGAQQSDGNTSRDAEALRLAGNANRSFEDNLKLIQLVSST